MTMFSEPKNEEHNWTHILNTYFLKNSGYTIWPQDCKLFELLPFIKNLNLCVHIRHSIISIHLQKHIQLTLVQHEFELHGSTYTRVFFFNKYCKCVFS